VYELLKSSPSPQQVAPLAYAVAQTPGVDGLIALIEFERRVGRPFVSWQSIQGAVTEHVPSENWKGAYNVVPVPAIDLRQRLLAMTTSGRPDDPAARALNAIDKLRDEYGAPEAEPRHPDLASGKQWPMIMSDPDAE
jgi:hypothetical protein